MIAPSLLRRRHVLAGLAGLAASLPLAARAQLDGLVADSDADQSAAMQAAIDAAAASGRLSLPAGRFRVAGLRLPGNFVIEGVPGATWLVGMGSMTGAISAQSQIVLHDIGFAGNSGTDPLFGVEASQGVSFERCLFRDGTATGLGLSGSAATIRDCDFAGLGDAAIHSLDSMGLLVTGNRIGSCGNAGIRIWRSAPGADGSIVTNNRISGIDWRDGGNGQNGNGINVYLADEVIVSGNQIDGCAFSAVRLNTTRNSQVSANQCRDSGEVAIFSEFGFSGSIIADNVVDGAAAGISITNMDQGGRLAICSGNIVRNIGERSEVNPDVTPIGIFAEADTVITGNVVDTVPGAGIGVGWGPYLRDVVVSDNLITGARIGIAVSIADGAGAATLSGNRIVGAETAVAGMLWTDIAEPDLTAAANKYPQLTIK